MSLVLSLLVMSAILISVISAANIIFRELRLTGTGQRGIQSFYAAESGLEQALYAFRVFGKTDLTITQGNAVRIGSGQWWRQSSVTIKELDATLSQNDTKEIVLYDIDSGSQAESMVVSWNTDPSYCRRADFAWMEIVQSYWTDAGTRSQRTLISPEEVQDCISQAKCPIVNFIGTYPYVRLRALYGDICNLNVRAYEGADGSGAQFELPSQLEITSIGEMGDTVQTLSVTVPTQAAQFNAFDYTIFSEKSFCKNVVCEE